MTDTTTEQPSDGWQLKAQQRTAGGRLQERAAEQIDSDFADFIQGLDESTRQSLDSRIVEWLKEVNKEWDLQACKDAFAEYKNNGKTPFLAQFAAKQKLVDALNAGEPSFHERFNSTRY